MNRTLPERIFISGFMGAGKSTVGTVLAKKVKMPFYDLDDYITAQAGQSIPTIFDKEGEEGFRRHERLALLDIIRNKKGVIALGGGTLQNQHIVDHIKVNGLLILINTPMETLIQRIRGDENRPMLLKENGEMKSANELQEELTVLYEQREPMYEQAEVTINSQDFESVDDLAANLLKKIKYHVALH